MSLISVVALLLLVSNRVALREALPVFFFQIQAHGVASFLTRRSGYTDPAVLFLVFHFQCPVGVCLEGDTVYLGFGSIGEQELVVSSCRTVDVVEVYLFVNCTEIGVVCTQFKSNRSDGVCCVWCELKTDALSDIVVCFYRTGQVCRVQGQHQLLVVGHVGIEGVQFPVIKGHKVQRILGLVCIQRFATGRRIQDFGVVVTGVFEA